MQKDGTITIQGKDITVKGSGGIDVKASKNVVIKGKKVLESGDHRRLPRRCHRPLARIP